MLAQYLLSEEPFPNSTEEYIEIKVLPDRPQ